MKRDSLFALRNDRIGDFTFDDKVAEVFPDMISRSVPGYGSILSMIGRLAEKFVVPDSSVYDLGCSLGAAALLIRDNIPRTCRVHAVDSSPAMVTRLNALLDSQPSDASGPPISVHLADIVGFPMSNASFCVLNFTLQFIQPDLRSELLRQVYLSLLQGGALLVSEKIKVDDHEAQVLLQELHEQFKRANGYSELEIAQKRTALEQTLIPETMDQHFARLTAAGFNLIVPWFQCFNFASILAVKN